MGVWECVRVSHSHTHTLTNDWKMHLRRFAVWYKLNQICSNQTKVIMVDTVNMVGTGWRDQIWLAQNQNDWHRLAKVNMQILIWLYRFDGI